LPLGHILDDNNGSTIDPQGPVSMGRAGWVCDPV